MAQLFVMFSKSAPGSPQAIASLAAIAKLAKTSQNAAAYVVQEGILARLALIVADAASRRWLLRTLGAITLHEDAFYLPAVYGEMIGLLLSILGAGGLHGSLLSLCFSVLRRCIEDGTAADCCNGVEVLANFLAAGPLTTAIVKRTFGCIQALLIKEVPDCLLLLLPHVDTVYAVMAAHITSPGVQWRAMDLLLKLEDGLDDGLEQGTVANCLAAVRAAMDTHPTDMSIQKIGCDILGALTAYLSDFLPTPVATKLILRAMDAVPDSCFLQTAACDALDSLAFKTGTPFIVQVCGKRVRQAMGAHHCGLVRTAGLEVLATIGQPPSLPLPLVFEDCDDDSVMPSPYKRCHA